MCNPLWYKGNLKILLIISTNFKKIRQLAVRLYSFLLILSHNSCNCLLIEDPYKESLLIDKMQAGSEEAFTALYKQYSPRLYVNILKMVRDPLVAEEIVQELFTRVWQKKTNKGIEENFGGYLYLIGQNLVHDFFRKLLRDKKLLTRFKMFATAHYEDMEEAINNREVAALLEKAIEQLSPQQKKVYELVKIDGLAYKKAAELMGISHFTVKEYLVTANKSIKNYLLNHVDTLAYMLVISATATRFA